MFNQILKEKEVFPYLWLLRITNVPSLHICSIQTFFERVFVFGEVSFLPLWSLLGKVPDNLSL